MKIHFGYEWNPYAWCGQENATTRTHDMEKVTCRKCLTHSNPSPRYLMGRRLAQ